MSNRKRPCVTERQQQELINDFIEGLGVDDKLIDGYNDINALDTVDDNNDKLMNEIVLGLDKAADADPDGGPSSNTNITNDQLDDNGKPERPVWKQVFKNLFLTLTICHPKQAKITSIKLKQC